MKVRQGAIAVALVVAMCAGCGSADSAHRSRTTTVADRSNGSTVTLQVGDHLKVVLSSTYWRFGPASKPQVLRSDVAPAPDPQLQGCVPGQGCGTETAMFTAVQAGTARVSASRETCGEVLRCRGSQGRFTLEVIVR